MGTKGGPLGIWSFRARLGGNHAHTGGGGRPGSGSLPGAVLFEPGLTDMVLQRIAPAPLSRPAQWLTGNNTRTIATVCAVSVWNDLCNSLDQTVATVQTPALPRAL